MLTSEYETRLATTVERYESKIAALKEEHKSALVNTTADHDTKYAMCVEKYEVGSLSHPPRDSPRGAVAPLLPVAAFLNFWLSRWLTVSLRMAD